MKDFEQRRQQETMNLLFSYTMQEDHLANDIHKYKFLGAAYDDKGNEVHVFLISEYPKPNASLERAERSDDTLQDIVRQIRVEMQHPKSERVLQCQSGLKAAGCPAEKLEEATIECLLSNASGQPRLAKGDKR